MYTRFIKSLNTPFKIVHRFFFALLPPTPDPPLFFIQRYTLCHTPFQLEQTLHNHTPAGRLVPSSFFEGCPQSLLSFLSPGFLPPLTRTLKEILIKISLEEESHYIMTKAKLYILHVSTEMECSNAFVLPVLAPTHSSSFSVRVGGPNCTHSLMSLPQTPLSGPCGMSPCHSPPCHPLAAGFCPRLCAPPF